MFWRQAANKATAAPPECRMENDKKNKNTVIKTEGDDHRVRQESFISPFSRVQRQQRDCGDVKSSGHVFETLASPIRSLWMVSVVVPTHQHIKAQSLLQPSYKIVGQRKQVRHFSIYRDRDPLPSNHRNLGSALIGYCDFFFFLNKKSPDY